MSHLISLTQAKQAFKIPLDVDLDDDALNTILTIAHELVLSSAKTVNTDDPLVKAARVATVNAWTSDTAPKGVVAAILELFGELEKDRGDGTIDMNEARRHWLLSPRADGFMSMIRAPVIR